MQDLEKEHSYNLTNWTNKVNLKNVNIEIFKCKRSGVYNLIIEWQIQLIIFDELQKGSYGKCNPLR